MERCLGLMAGAGILPGRAAAEARRQGWRVVAFAFDDAPGLADAAHRVQASTLSDLGSVLTALGVEAVSAVAFVGAFAKQTVFASADRMDAAARGLGREGFSDDSLGRKAVELLAGMGIDVLDQRRFLGPWLVTAERLTARAPDEGEWAELREGWRLARDLANRGVGQTVVRARGVTVAVEAAEGTDAAIRRGVRTLRPGRGGREGGRRRPRLPLRHPHHWPRHTRFDGRGWGDRARGGARPYPRRGRGRGGPPRGGGGDHRGHAGGRVVSAAGSRTMMLEAARAVLAAARAA